MARRAGNADRAVKKPSLKATKPRGAPKTARQSPRSTITTSSINDLREQLDLRTRELNEAHEREAAAVAELRGSVEQQAAASEVLGLISRSPGTLELVFSAILEKATRICGATFGTLYLREADGFRNVAFHNAPPAFVAARKREPLIRPPPGSPFARAAATMQVIYTEDVRNVQADQSPFLNEIGGIRTLLIVPMVRDKEMVGAIAFYRQEVRSFTDKQVDLVKNFAAQAVIAVENARLLNELRQRTDDLTESLEQQTATSEVLRVISGSPGALEPVFQVMLEKATRLCGAKFGTLYRYDGELAYRVAGVDTPPALDDFLTQRGPFKPNPQTNVGRCLHNKSVVHMADASAEPHPGASARYGDARSCITVPMLKDDRPMVLSFSTVRRLGRLLTNRSRW